MYNFFCSGVQFILKVLVKLFLPLLYLSLFTVLVMIFFALVGMQLFSGNLHGGCFANYRTPAGKIIIIRLTPRLIPIPSFSILSVTPRPIPIPSFSTLSVTPRPIPILSFSMLSMHIEKDTGNRSELL